MNLQNFCEVPQWLYAEQGHFVHKNGLSTNNGQWEKMNKRTRLDPGSHRMFIPEYRTAIANARTIGEIVEIMYKALSASGYNSDLPKKCLVKINEAKHNTQEL